MSSPAASPSSFSSGSSLTSAASSWTSSLSHFHDHCSLSAMNPANTSSSSCTPGALPATPSIASLPSLAHSLSAFPTMTVVPNDMVHYGSRTKDASQKLNSALLVTRQRQGAAVKPKPVGAMSPHSPAGHIRYPTPEDDDPVIVMVSKRTKAKRSS